MHHFPTLEEKRAQSPTWLDPPLSQIHLKSPLYLSQWSSPQLILEAILIMYDLNTAAGRRRAARESINPGDLARKPPLC